MICFPLQMVRQMSGLPGVHAQSPAERDCRAVPAFVLLLQSPPSAQDPCVRTSHATTQSCVRVSIMMAGRTKRG